MSVVLKGGSRVGGGLKFSFAPLGCASGEVCSKSNSQTQAKIDKLEANR
jgi:hypothetical protein